MATENETGESPSLVRKDIEIVCVKVSDEDEKLERLAEALKDLNPATSRAVVFATSRSSTHQLAQWVRENTLLSAGAFHAGLPTETRREAYESFMAGEIAVLCATKAFGMGMDVDNIHTVVHFGPPSNLEDYFQEIGRAARKHSAMKAAGLSTAKAWLLYSEEDFRKTQDRLKRGSMSVDFLMRIGELIDNEKTRREDATDAGRADRLIIEPARLATQMGSRTTETEVRQGLFWLEKLGRVRLGYYVPLEITALVNRQRVSQGNTRSVSGTARNLLEWLTTKLGSEAHEGDFVRVHISVEQAAEGVPGISGQKDLFERLIELSEMGFLQIERKLLMPLTQTRASESRSCGADMDWPFLIAVLKGLSETADLIQTGLERGEPFNMSKEVLTDHWVGFVSESLHEEEFDWEDIKNRKNTLEREKRRLPRKLPAVLRLLRKMRFFRVEEPSLKRHEYEFRAGDARWAVWRGALKGIVCHSLYKIVTLQDDPARSKQAGLEVGAVDGGELLQHIRDQARQLGVEISTGQMEKVFGFLRDLGYIGRTDTFVPIALELGVIDARPLDPHGADKEGLAEFSEHRRMRALRLAALQVLTYLENVQAIQQFAQRYQEISSSQDLLELIEDTLPPQAELLGILREEALKRLLDGDEATGSPGLSLQQRAVYDAPTNEHLLVIAGPGAGKTHTLLARLVRLIHQESVAPNEILVLAFTRAVVSELRFRLNDLLRGLGYSSLARQINVRTFHAFALEVLRHNGVVSSYADLGGDDAFTRLKDFLRDNPPAALELGRRFRHVFVDEFQDVHGPRFELLDVLARGKKTFFLVVGDDDQSIYDYERQQGEGDAAQCFERFKKAFKPTSLFLDLNFRSAQRIVDNAQDVVFGLPGRQKGGQSLVSFRSQRKPEMQGVVEWVAPGTDLVGLVGQAQQRLDDLRKAGLARSSNNTVAVLARTNADVYRVKAQLERAMGEDVRVHVQGDESRFWQRRDVVKVFHVLRDQVSPSSSRSMDLMAELRTCVSRGQFKTWLSDAPVEQHELWYLAKEYQEGAGENPTIDGFADFVRDVSENGNYLRIVARRQSAEGTGSHILLSTVHKVKGLEFPAVILLDSQMRVDPTEIPTERRVMYVGLTRAEDVAFAVHGEREERLLRGEPYDPPDGNGQDLAVAPSLADVFISYYGRDWQTQKTVIFTKVLPGDAVTVERTRNEYGNLEYGIRHVPTACLIGKLASANLTKKNLASKIRARFPNADAIDGLKVTGVFQRFTELDELGDKMSEGALHFYERLSPEVKKADHYYVVEIGGLARPAAAEPEHDDHLIPF